MSDVKIKLKGEYSALDKLKAKVKTTAQFIKAGFTLRIGQRIFDGLLRGLREIPQLIRNAVDEASNLGEALSKSEAVFGAQSGQIAKWAEGAAAALGQSKEEAISAAGTFGNLFVAMGMTGAESAKMSMRLVELASDLASFNNTSPEEAITAIGAALWGEAEPIRRYGVLLDAATLSAEAMNQGISDGKGTLAPAARALAAYGVILRQTTVAQGDFARTSDGLANSQRQIAAQLKDASSRIGESLVPHVEALANELEGVDMNNLIASAGEALVAIKNIAKYGGGLGLAFQAYSKMRGTDRDRADLDLGDEMRRVRVKVDARSAEATAYTREDLAREAAEAAEIRMELDRAMREQIAAISDPGQQAEALAALEMTTNRMRRQEEAILAISDAQLAANQAKRDAARAEAEHREAMEKSAKEYEKALESYEKTLAAIDAKRVSGLSLEDQIEELNAAEQALRKGLNSSLQVFHGDKSASDLADIIGGTANHPAKSADMQIAKQLLEIEQQRSEALKKIADQDAERAAAKEKATADYESTLEILKAEIDGNDERLQQLQDEAKIRAKIAELTAAGVDNPEEKARKMVAAERGAELARSLASGGSIEPQKYMSATRAVSSMAAVGGGGGVYSAGLNYEREVANLNRQQLEKQRDMVRLLEEIRQFI